MRTKQTRGRKTNGGVRKASTPSPSMARSPAQPQDLSDKDRERLKKYLHNNPKAFTVVTVPPSRKRKRASPNLHTETNLAQERLAVEYEIKPANNWESLRRYKKFTGMRKDLRERKCLY